MQPSLSDKPVQHTSVLFSEQFNQPTLDPAWTVDVSEGNTIRVNDGALEIQACTNTYAHIERDLRVDLVRASCEIEPGSGISWCTSVFLYWGAGDWCQMGVIPRKGGRYYACVTSGGQRSELDLTRCRFENWHHVAIELAEDGIRFLSSQDGRSWITETFVARPARLNGPPASLILGKGFGLDETGSDLDSDYGERGPITTSRIRAVLVESTDPARRRIIRAERDAREAADRDPRGTAVLSRTADPDFEVVAALFPPLAKPREIVGVKDHPYEIGVEYDATIQIADDSELWEQTGAVAFFEVGTPPVPFGSAGCQKRLLEGYLPVVVCTGEHDGLQYEQTVFGHSEGMNPDAPLWACVRLKVTNPSRLERSVGVALRVASEPDRQQPARRELTVPADGSDEICFEIPSPLMDRSPAEVAPIEFAKKLDEVATSWRGLLNSGMEISVPEARVNHAHRAWLAYNFLNVDKKDGRYEPHDGGGFYEEIYGYSAALYCNALDLWGRHADSRRYLQSLLTLQKADGLFFVRYGLPDHGAMLFALSEHYRLTGDAAWLRATAPKMVAMCNWIIDRREEAAKRTDDDRLAIRGLVRFTPYADFQSATFNYYGDAYCCIGMEHAARALRDIGLTGEADRIAACAGAYRQDILAAMEAAVVERDGVKLLPLEPDTQRILKSTNYRGGGYYGLVASMLLESEFLPASDTRACWLVNALERRGGLILGMCEFDEGVDHAYTYGYWLNCLRRDEVRRVLLGFYGTLAYGMGRETYCGVEVTQISTGEPTPTTPHLYSGTQQLRLLRNMLLREEGDDLLIGYAIPRHWLADGERVVVKDAPTTFGRCSFAIASSLRTGSIGVHIGTPDLSARGTVKVRLRHPGQHHIRAVETEPKVDVVFEDDTIELAGLRQTVNLKVKY